MARPLRLLLIEDSDDDAQLLVRELRNAGFDVAFERVETRETTAAAFGRGGFDAVVSDYRLPTFSAPEALALYKQSGLEAPFLVVSGTIGEEQAAELLKAGAHDFFLKERLSRLGTAVERELREAENRRARRRAEADLRRSHRLLEEARNRYERATAVAKVGVWDWDLATGEIHVDPGLKALLGFADGEIRNHVDDWGRRVHPEDAEEVSAAARAHLEGRMPVYEVERRMLHKDGSVRWFLSRGVALRDPAGTPLRLVGADLDVSERRDLERMLHLSQKLEAVGRLAGGIAHDFNNILAVITGQGESALRLLEPENLARGRLGEILEAAARAARLTRQLLAFSRKQILEPQVLDVNAALTELEKMLRRVLGAHVELELRSGRDLGAVKADPTQLEQVIVNLALNARDAMPEGGHLTIETANVDLDEAYAAAHPPARPGPYIMVAVSDNGIGMDAETQRQIFEPFFTTKPPGEGTGLGLATVYGVVKQSGGYVWVYSEPGRGTTFKIYLPRVDEAPAARDESPAPAPVARGHERILLVEDNDGLREVMREALEARGYAVFSTSDADEALAFAREHEGPVELLLTDIIMPRTGGVELARQVSSLRPGIRVLYISGYSNGAISRRGILDAGAKLLEKPFTSEALARAVRAALDATGEGR